MLLLQGITILTAVAATAASCRTGFTLISGYLCINSPFVETFRSVASEQLCALLCGVRPQCQAFSVSDGPCQLFVFNKCSKSVRDCSCTRRGRVFVRQQPGLPPGLLCPAGYGDDWCGVKYRVYDSPDRSWVTSRQKCENESGLVIMADVTDAAEMDHVESIRTKYLSSGSLWWLGGFQAPGSVEPAGGWHWVGCNITVDSGLWAVGEPNNNIGSESTIAMFPGLKKLVDMPDNFSGTSKLLCECVSPLD